MESPKYSNDIDEFYLEYKLNHYKQLSNWDCGISCILMILEQGDREYLISNLVKVSEEEGFNHSTWTIDLCYLLKKFHIEHKYFTVTLGVRTEYRNENYYSQIILRDQDRVNGRFENALSSGVCVRQASLQLEAILRHLRCGGPIILLVNANLLSCDLCKFNKFNVELKSCLPWKMEYLGHYILLCGYNTKKRKIFYRNPSFGDRLCAISYHGLENARKSHGTDEDIIFIFKMFDKN